VVRLEASERDQQHLASLYRIPNSIFLLYALLIMFLTGTCEPCEPCELLNGYSLLSLEDVAFMANPTISASNDA
jgi:hypothetical protein